jgi:prevent-host-death family protein
MDSLTASEARARLPSLLDCVEMGEEVVITRHGRPVAVMVRPDNLRSRRADKMMETATRIEQALESARRQPIPSEGLSRERAEELVAEVRRGRSQP